MDLQFTLASDFDPVQANEQVVAAFDGIAAADIVDKKLSFTLRSAYRKYASPRAAGIGGHFWDGTFHGSRVSLLRQPLGNPVPKLLYVQFKMSMRLQTPVLPNQDSGVDIASIIMTAPSGQQFGEIIGRISPGGDFGPAGESLTVDRAQFFTGEVLVTVILNHTGAPKTYSAPNNASESVGGAHYDYWINQTKIADEAPSLTSRPLLFFGITVKAGEPPFMATRPPEGTLPDSPGPPAIITFDDFVIRADLPVAAPDADGDGLADLLETYFGTHPGQPNPSPLAVRRSGNTTILAWPEADAANKTILAQWSPDMVHWLASGESRNGIPARTITVTTPSVGQKEASLASDGAAFLRLKISQP